jgi:hypothetical protein
MKKLALALLLLLPTTVFAATAKPTPADFTVTVHVVYSRFVFGETSNLGHQELETVIDGQQVELRSEADLGVLALGDYKAMYIATYKALGVVNGYIPKRQNGFDIFSIYRFLMPDGSVSNYYVTGLGPKDGYTAAPAPTNP